MRKTNSISNRQKHPTPHNYSRQILQCLPGGAALSTSNSLSSMQRVLKVTHYHQHNDHPHPYSNSNSKSQNNHLTCLRQTLMNNPHLRKLFDQSLSKTLAIETIAIEEKIKSMSKFVVKGSFDLGLGGYYSRVAQHVDTHLRSKGIEIEETEELKREKEIWWRKRLEILQERNDGVEGRRRGEGVGKERVLLPSLSMHASVSTTGYKQLQSKQSNEPPFMYQRMNKQHKIRRSQYENGDSPNTSSLFILDDI